MLYVFRRDLMVKEYHTSSSVLILIYHLVLSACLDNQIPQKSVRSENKRNPR